MALAPSLWPAAGKAPPASIIPKIVDVHLFGGVVVAALPLALPAPPTEAEEAERIVREETANLVF
jgi:hypothetical protein